MGPGAVEATCQAGVIEATAHGLEQRGGSKPVEMGAEAGAIPSSDG